MEFLRQTVTLQISTPASDGVPSDWDWADLLEVDSDMVTILDLTYVESLEMPEDEGGDLTYCRECGYTLRQDSQGTWIDLTDGDVCYDDVQHTPQNV